MTTFDCSELCRLCLVKDRVKVPIFEGEGDARQVSFKIGTCLPIKVTREDRFPKQVCEDCINKLDLVYDFWTTTVNSERQLSQWVGDAGDGEDKQGYVSITDELMKQETAENRLMEGSVMNQNDQNTNININMMDQMGLTMPIIISNNQQQQQQQHQQMTMQGVSGTSSDANQRGNKRHHEEVEASDDEGDIEGLDNDDAVKSEDIDGTSNRPTGHEPTFVSIACDDGAGPSGLQQQKMDMSDMIMTQADVDPKSGPRRRKVRRKKSPKKTNQSTSVAVVRSTRIPRSPQKKSRTLTRKSSKLPKEALASTDGTTLLDSNFTDLLSCDFCDFKCNDKSTMQCHLLENHDDDNFPKKTGNPIEGTKKYVCNICDLVCSKKEVLNAHFIRKHTENFEFTCDKCNKKFKIKGDLTTHLKRTHSDQPVVCDVCGKSCRDKHSLYLHQKYAHYKGKFVCGKCGKCLTTQENLDLHIKHQHQEKERIMCEECGKTFNAAYELRKHMRVHTGEKPYACNICERTFARHCGLNQHLLLHTGEKLYVCDVCGRSFAQKAGLIGHRKKHDGDLPPLPHMQIDHLVKDMKKKKNT